MGIVTKTIGTGARNYSLLQSWEDALPADLVADGNSQVGECYADSEFVSGSQLLVISGQTTDSTHTITLRCATGQSFSDNASRLTNRLAYNAANGVAIRFTGGYDTGILVGTANVFVNGLQVKSTSSTSNAFVGAGTANVMLSNCIFHSNSGSNSTVAPRGPTAKVVNCVVINEGSGGGGTLAFESGGSAFNCTLIKPSNQTAGGSATTTSYGTATVKNCAIFGFTSVSGSYNADGHNVTDAASAPGSLFNLVGKTYGGQFEQSSTAGGVEDFRIKTGADCIGAGVRDVVDTNDLDILLQTRDLVAPTAGAHEYVASGGGTSLSPTPGALTLTGYAPSIAQPQSLSPAPGAVTLTGYAPSITQPQTLNPAAGVIALTGYAPTINQVISISPTPGALVLTGYAPTIAQPHTVAPAPGALALVGHAPSIRQAAIEAGPPLNRYTIMRLSVINGATPLSAAAINGAGGNLSANLNRYTIMRATAVSGQAVMSDDPINHTVSLP